MGDSLIGKTPDSGSGVRGSNPCPPAFLGDDSTSPIEDAATGFSLTRTGSSVFRFHSGPTWNRQARIQACPRGSQARKSTISSVLFVAADPV